MRAKVIRVAIGLVIFGVGVVIDIAQYIPNLMVSEQVGNAIIGGVMTFVGFWVIFWPALEKWQRDFGRGTDARKDE